MKHYIFILFFSISAIVVSAQQIATSSMYDLQGSFHNPSVAGVQKHGVIGATYRAMWDGIEGRFQQFSFDRAKLQASLGNDPAIGSTSNKVTGDAGFGMSYTSKKFQVGASVSQLIQSKMDFYQTNLGGGSAALPGRTQQAQLYRHYFLHGYYIWNVDDHTTITPNAMFIYLPNAPLEFQGGARVEHNELFWWGLALRAKQSWMISAGLRINKVFTVGYCFDIYTTPLSVYDKGSNGHEILLKYDFAKKKD